MSTPATFIEVTVNAPGPWLATNDRHHWSVRAARTKVWRQAAALYARQSKARTIPGPVAVTATIHKATRVRYDLDGATATVKACIDGLRDAGVLDEDDTTAVASLLVLPGEVRKPACVVLTLGPEPFGVTAAQLSAAAAIVQAEADERGMRHWTDLADRLTREAALRAVPREDEDDE